MKTSHRVLGLLVAASFVGVMMIVIAPPVMAGEMVIEEGTSFHETFSKDGRRVEVTKTYRRDGVEIHQKIYNEATGALIREKTTVNPLKAQVRIAAPGERPVSPKDERAKREVPVKNPDTSQNNKVREQNVNTDTSEAHRVAKTAEEIADQKMEEAVGPEVKIEAAKQRYGITKVNRVFVGQEENKSELAITGTKLGRLLGLYPVEIPVDVVVDSETGDLVSERKTLLGRLLALLSTE
jgi:FtsZ-interacting cell division protein ZipA